MSPVSSAVSGIDQYGKEFIVWSPPPNSLPNNSKQLLSLHFVIVCQETIICRFKQQVES